MKVHLKIPATTANLGPGFDTLGLALNIFNYLEVETKTEGLEIIVTGEGAGELSTGSDNLVYQAMSLVFKNYNQKPPGLKIVQHNEIPLSRGLGSSAAAIVGGLVAANEILDNPFAKDQLLNMATEMEGHPDNVAPALLGGLVISCVEENQVKYCNVKPTQPLDIVVVIPDFQLSTRATRAILPKKIPFTDATYNASRVALLVSSFCTGDYSLLEVACGDKLHQDYRAQLIPGLREVLQTVKATGGAGGCLSGAGPSVVGFTTDNPEQLGLAMQKVFANNQVNSEFVITDINTKGIEIFKSAI